MSKNDMLGTSTLADVARLLGAFSDRLAGEDGEVWIAAFKRFLRKENPWPAPEVAPPKSQPAPVAAPPPIAVWKTITIGGKSKDELLEALEAAGFRITDWARDMMAKEAFTTEAEPREIDLAKMTVRDLGFTSKPTTKQLFARIAGLGGEKLPPSAGAHLRIDYCDQLRGEYLWMVMEPIVCSDGYPCVLRVGRDVGGRWLRGSDANPDDGWFLESVVVFGVSRK